MVIFSLILYVVLGLSAGLLSGLLGVSGGVITIPSLLLIFHLLGFPAEALMQLAIGTSLASMVFNGMVATWVHHQAKDVLWSVFRRMALGLILGSLFGAYLGQHLSTATLKLIFALFALYLGVYFYLKKDLQGSHWLLPSTRILDALGFGVGILSNILGIGGGSLIVPALSACKIPIKKAVGTAAATGGLVTLFGAATYLFWGYGQALYPHCLGYLYLPAFAVLSLTTSLAAPLGAKLTHRLPTLKLCRYFAILMVFIGLSMLL